MHHRLVDGDLYFMANHGKAAVSTEARFNVRGKAAEFWHADTGRIESVSYRTAGKATGVPLALGATNRCS